VKVKHFVVSLIVLTSLFVGLFAKTPRAGLAAPNAQAAVTPVGQGTNWTLTFNDDFNGTSLNRTVWRSDYFPNGGNGEMQQYVSDNSHNNYIVQNGMLQIVGRKEPLNGRSYTSGIVHTKSRFLQKYGYFEIRAQVPNGKGFWPAFWLLPDQDNWVPEIDVTEILCDRPNLTYMTLHYHNTSGAYVQTQSQYTGPDFSAGWHTFAVDWEPNALVWYVDGVERKRVTDTTAIPNMPLYLIANLAVGGSWPGSPDSSTVFPGYFNIDYMRVWQKSSGPTATSRPATATPVGATATPVATRTNPPAGTNLITNASFDDTSMAPWAYRNDLGAAFSQDTTTAANGTRASFKAALSSSNNSQPWVVSVNQSNKALNAGQSYTLNFWAKASTTRSIRAVVQLQNSPYTEYTNQGANLTGSWARYTYTFTAPATTTAAMLNFNLASATGSVWIDDVVLCQAGTACPSTPAPLPSATATKMASPTALPPTAIPTNTATLKPTALPPTATSTPATTSNLMSNASFDDAGITPWNTRNDLGAAFSQDTTTTANGTRASLKAALSGSNSSQPWVVSVSQSNKSLTAGQSYTLSFWAKASMSRSIRAIIQLQNSPYTEYTNQGANLTGSWARYTYTFTAPATTTAAMLNFNLASATGSVWIDDVSLCRTGMVCK
jgi:beta-glucanase (GH16 family)